MALLKVDRRNTGSTKARRRQLPLQVVSCPTTSNGKRRHIRLIDSRSGPLPKPLRQSQRRTVRPPACAFELAA